MLLVGLVVFMTAVVDHPFRGTRGIYDRTTEPVRALAAERSVPGDRFPVFATTAGRGGSLIEQ